MPLYEYQCEVCHYQTEVLQRFDDPLLTDCPECGKKTFIKMVSAAGFQLTGSGWYETDFKDKKPQPIKTENASDTSAEKKVEQKAEQKPEKKVEKKTAEEK